jgi:hypothetical protein
MQLPDKMDDVKQDTYDGMDEIIGVADSGFDKGDQGPMGDQAEPLHPAFKDRIIKLVPVTRWQENATSATEDTSGHGTFVCGNVAGDGTSGSWLLGERIKGTAPKAKLVVQAIGTGGGEMFLPRWLRVKIMVSQASSRNHMLNMELASTRTPGANTFRRSSMAPSVKSHTTKWQRI